MNAKIEDLIKRSGIITHHQTIECLRSKDWKVRISPYYYDNVANTTKEIDIVAEKVISFPKGSFDEPEIRIFVQLFFECKYIDQEIIFWFDNLDKNKAIDKLEQDTYLNLHSCAEPDYADPKFFHYLNSNRVVKLFSTNANNTDVMYKAISQCLNAQIYHSHWLDKPLMNEVANRINIVCKIIRYPIVICDGFDKLFEVKIEKEKEFTTEKIKNEFLLETNYAHLDKSSKLVENSYFLIDIVDLKYLKDFLDKLEQEAKSLLSPFQYKFCQR